MVRIAVNGLANRYEPAGCLRSEVKGLVDTVDVTRQRSDMVENLVVDPTTDVVWNGPPKLITSTPPLSLPVTFTVSVAPSPSTEMLSKILSPI